MVRYDDIRDYTTSQRAASHRTEYALVLLNRFYLKIQHSIQRNVFTGKAADDETPTSRVNPPSALDRVIPELMIEILYY